MALDKFLLNPSSHNNLNKKVPIYIMLTIVYKKTSLGVINQYSGKFKNGLLYVICKDGKYV